MFSSMLLKYVLAAIFVVCLIVLIVCTVIEKKLQKETCGNYINEVRRYANEGESLLAAWKKVLVLFPEKSIEYRKIKEAIEFMDTSIIPDYTKAASIVEIAFPLKEVKQLHKDLLTSDHRKVPQTISEGGTDE